MPNVLSFSHCVVICTLNREKSLDRLLATIAVARASKELRVIIVDSSTDETYKSRLREFLGNNFSSTSTVLTDAGGLPTCRNVAIDHLTHSDNLIHFFDDDITVPEEYFEKCDQFFALHPEVDGGGPRIFGLYQDYQKSRLKNLTGQNPLSQQGKLTRSGRNNWVLDNEASESLSVDWIPGCSMIFKKRVLETQRFSSNLEKGPGRNYALGEDVDFGWRVSRKFKLQSIPTVAITHHLAPSKRDNQKLMQEASGVWLAYLTRLTEGHVHKTRVLADLYFDLLNKLIIVNLLRLLVLLKHILKSVAILPINLFKDSVSVGKTILKSFGDTFREHSIKKKSFLKELNSPSITTQ